MVEAILIGMFLSWSFTEINQDFLIYPFKSPRFLIISCIFLLNQHLRKDGLFCFWISPLHCIYETLRRYNAVFHKQLEGTADVLGTPNLSLATIWLAMSIMASIDTWSKCFADSCFIKSFLNSPNGYCDIFSSFVKLSSINNIFFLILSISTIDITLLEGIIKLLVHFPYIVLLVTITAKNFL